MDAGSSVEALRPHATETQSAVPLTSMDQGFRHRRRTPLLPDAVLGMIFFIFAEVMLFSGFISGFAIIKANAPGNVWPPPGQPRLPIEATAFNSLLLLMSGALLWYAGRRFAESPEKARTPFLAAIVLGMAFVGLQGREWLALIGEGLTFTSSSYGSFFYMIVGCHALHAVSAILALVWLVVRLQRGTLSREAFIAGRMFWYFVVLVWPFLYWQVYLG
ncbi:MAG: cytochrome c oxidase subunit 3 [Alphaproteobacteria bacterium]|nr:cytochrome c oxidase subunit 3 [Alphaproteobacteria bacterium]